MVESSQKRRVGAIVRVRCALDPPTSGIRAIVRVWYPLDSPTSGIRARLWLINRFVLVINLNMVWMKLYVDVNFMQFNIWYVDCDSWFDRRIFDSRFSRFFFVNPKFKGYRLYVIIIIIIVIRWCDVLDHDDRRKTDTPRRSMTDEESLHDYATRKLVTKFCDKSRPSFSCRAAPSWRRRSGAASSLTLT